MELHGGSIAVTSEGIGRGSCFSIELPVASNQHTSDADELDQIFTAFDTSPVDAQMSQSSSKESPLARSLSQFLWRSVVGSSRVEATRSPVVLGLNRLD